MSNDKNTAISKDLVAASATPLVLSILGQGEAYGYLIIKRVRELSGMLYPVLHRLEERGLIESTWRESEKGRRRKYYRLKDAGRRELSVQRSHWMLVNETLQKSWEGGW
jgi:PadR family transcriptional regulator